MDFDMAADTAPARSPLETAYLGALRAIIHNDEPAANGYLNQVKNVLKTSPDRKALTETHIRSSLSDGKLSQLYGDYGSEGHDPWIKDADLVRMIGRHLIMLGANRDDKKAFDIFSQTVQKDNRLTQQQHLQAS